MRRLLVTGGAGFIGGNFVHHWHEQYPQDHLVVLDALTYAGNLATIDALVRSGAVSFVHGDITDRAKVTRTFADHGIDTVVHFAAESHVDRSILAPDAFITTNVVGTGVLLDAARHAWKSGNDWRPGVRFHHVSTDEVYGSLGAGDAPFTESTPYAPNSPYAASKAGADHLVRAYVHTYGLPASISNCSNNYGPYHFPEKLIPLAIVNVLEGRSVPVYGDGRQIRDWLYVGDHCEAIELILRTGTSGRVYNVGGRAEHENIALIQELCALIDARFARDPSLARRFPSCPPSGGIPSRTLITHVTDRAGHDRRYAIDPTRVSSELGFEPRQTLATGLGRTVDWYLANEPWWRGVMDGSYRRWIATQYGD